MRAITFQDVESLDYGEVPDPQLIAPTDAIVRVEVAGICGSDLHPYFGRERGLDPGTVMGHEFLGEVIEVGNEVKEVRLGDRVVAPFTTSCGDCFYCVRGLTARCTEGQLFGWVAGGEGLHGGQADFVRVPLAGSSLVAVPDGVDPAVALLAGDILSTATFGAELARVGSGDVVVVVGCGPVGLLSVLTAFERGAREVLAVDRVESRLATAASFGATPLDLDRVDLVDAVRSRTEGQGADAAIEAVGSASATKVAADALRYGGRIGAVGVHTEAHLALSPGELYDRNLTYAAGRCPARHFMPAALELAARHQERIASLVSHRLPLAEGVAAYRHFAARAPGWNKVVLLTE